MSFFQYIPLPVLYGVFLYMGVAPLGSMQVNIKVLCKLILTTTLTTKIVL